MRIGFVTSSGYPGLTEDDRLAVEALKGHDVAVEPVIWNDPGAGWRTLDGLVLRSTWDYHLDPAGFLDWINRVESAGVPLWNPPDILRWNQDKQYLRTVESWGCPIPETVWLNQGAKTSVATTVTELNTQDAVIKPVVGGGSHGVIRLSRVTPAQAERHLQQILATGDAMIQAFAPEIEADGELSLVFLAGQYSHAVIKRPAAGDFRVQDEVGGSHAPVEPGGEVILQAGRILGRLGGQILYARVDGYLRNGRLVVMELELLEPTLFLATNPLAPGRFAAAISQALAGPRPIGYTLTP